MQKFFGLFLKLLLIVGILMPSLSWADGFDSADPNLKPASDSEVEFKGLSLENMVKVTRQIQDILGHPSRPRRPSSQELEHEIRED